MELAEKRKLDAAFIDVDSILLFGKYLNDPVIKTSSNSPRLPGFFFFRKKHTKSHRLDFRITTFKNSIFTDLYRWQNKQVLLDQFVEFIKGHCLTIKTNASLKGRKSSYLDGPYRFG